MWLSDSVVVMSRVEVLKAAVKKISMLVLKTKSCVDFVIIMCKE